MKCELLFQMTEQSYPSLFTLTIGFIVFNFDCKPMSLVKNWHRQLVLSRNHFSNYLRQHDKKTLFLQTALLKFIHRMSKKFARIRRTQYPFSEYIYLMCRGLTHIYLLAFCVLTV